MRKNFRKAAILAALLLSLQLVFSPFASLSAAQINPDGIAANGGLLTIVTDGKPNPVKNGPPANFANSKIRPSTATFTVNYTGFSAQAQTAFQYAVDIWSSQITSSVPIIINANWTTLQACNPGQACILGSAGAAQLRRDFTGAPQANTWYGIALANKLSGSDLNPALNDITAQFNNGYPNWYFGTDGNTPVDQVDFVSVVLHEIGHGLNFFGGMTYSGGTGSYGFGAAPAFPSIYDRFAVNGTSQSLINTALFPNPSTALGSQLVSGNIFFDSPTVREINAGNPAKLYSPGSWAQGSSFSHLDEIYNGTPNALMTFSIGGGEVQHSPGPIMLAMFKDMGWTVALAPNAPTLLTATTASSTQINLAWTDNSTYETNYRVERSPNGTTWSPLITLPASTVAYNDTGLTPGTTYFYRVLATNAGTDSGFSNTANATTNTVISLVVKLTADGGDAVDQDTADTLSFALKRATNGQTITFQLNGGATTINVSGALRSVPAGVGIDGGICTTTGITLNATDTAATNPAINGLVLGGANLRNLKITKFGGNQIVANTGRDILSCVVASKT